MSSPARRTVARARAARRPRHKKSNPLWALLGFAVFVAALVYAIVAIAQFQAKQKVVARNYRRDVAAIRERVEKEKEIILAERDEWAEKLRELQKQNLLVKQQVQSAQNKFEESREKLEAMEERKEEIDRRAEVQVEDRELVGESVQELRLKVEQLKRQRDHLLETFKEAYIGLKSELKQLTIEGNPDRVRQFFFTNRTTAVGPAAAFFAADMYYEQKKTKDALRLYQDLVTQFPDSPYTAKAEKRIADITAKWPYDMYDPPKFHPYKIPDSLDFGAWEF